jgi:hypothetical protein
MAGEAALEGDGVQNPSSRASRRIVEQRPKGLLELLRFAGGERAEEGPLRLLRGPGRMPDDTLPGVGELLTDLIEAGARGTLSWVLSEYLQCSGSPAKSSAPFSPPPEAGSSHARYTGMYDQWDRVSVKPWRTLTTG